MSPGARARRVVRHTFRSLAIRNYRLFFVGQLVSLSGTWMHTVAQGWLVLRLSDSGFAVGVVTGLQFLPMLLGGMWGGVVADRFDKRRSLLAVQAVMAVLAAILAVLTLADLVELWMVYLLALLNGVTTVVDMPTRQAFVAEMVGPEEVSNAVGLNSAMFNGARLIGPALAGVVIVSFGVGVCFAANAVSFLAAIAALAAMRPGELYRRPGAVRGKRQVREGLRYVWAHPLLRSTLLVVAVVGTFAFNFMVVLPLLARDTFGGGPGTFGSLTAVMGGGSLVGALVAAGRTRLTPRLLLGSLGLFGLLMAAGALAPTLAWEVPLLIGMGAAMMLFLATANTTLQLGSSPHMRGRVMALYGLVFLGTTPLGGPVMGWIAEHLGPRAAMGTGAVVTLMAWAAAGGVHMRARRRGAAISTLTEPSDGERETDAAAA